MGTVCERNLCDGCKACLSVCTKGAITIEENMEAFNALIEEALCVKCNQCRKTCQRNRSPKAVKPIQWYQGWACEDEVRARSASGGAASALIHTFQSMGGAVCCCVFEEGHFGFRFLNPPFDMKRVAGSKYVKSDPQGIYEAIEKKLKLGEKVLFIGLPCQVAAVKNYCGAEYTDKLYTVDLICHGTPSVRTLELFVQQYGIKPDDLEDIKFRKKARFQVFEEQNDSYKRIAKSGVQDCYMTAFLNGLSYTENCYHCNYAKLERVSDVTLGDSWGSRLPQEEMMKGISLILCQTTKGLDLVHRCALKLEPVNLETAVRSNSQLRAPAPKPPPAGQIFPEPAPGT